MRFAAFLIVLAVAVGAFLLFRTPAGDAGGVSPQPGATAGPDDSRAAVDLARGAAAPEARSQVAPHPDSEPKKAEAPAGEPDRPVANSATAIPVLEVSSSVHGGSGDPGMAKKYDGTTPDQRRQALETIRQHLEYTPNLEAQEVATLKNELEWLQESLEG